MAAAAPARHHVLRPTDTPEATLVVDGIHLTSGYDRRAEAEQQARLIPDGRREAWIYGAALGDLPRVLLRRPALKQLHVVLLNVDLFVAVCSWTDQTDWLTDDRVVLHVAAPTDDLKHPFAASPSELHLVAPHAYAVRDKLWQTLGAPHARTRYRAAAARHPFEATLPWFAEDPDVAALFGSALDTTVLVAAGGPSLGGQLDLLQALHHDYPLVALLDAWPTLRANGLSPDVVLAVGPDVPTRSPEPAAPSGPPPALVYSPLADPHLVATWLGPRYGCYLAPVAPHQQALAAQLPRGHVYSTGSPAVAATDLAVRLGAACVVFAGLDFVASTRGPSTWVVDGHGQRLATSAQQAGYLRDLEAYIARTPTTGFVTCSCDGAAIAGTAYLDDLAPVHA